MENHHCLWENSLFLWSFSIAMKLPEGTMCPLLFQASCTQFEVPTASWRCLFGENFESLTLKLIMDIILYIYIIYIHRYLSQYFLRDLDINSYYIPSRSIIHLIWDLYLGSIIYPISSIIMGQSQYIYIYISHLVHKGIYR